MFVASSAPVDERNIGAEGQWRGEGGACRKMADFRTVKFTVTLGPRALGAAKRRQAEMAEINGHTSRESTVCRRLSANETRELLICWKQQTRAARPSMRALARELGTSHQLLQYYLKTLLRWQGKQYFRKAKEVYARAESENRFTTPEENRKALEFNRAGVAVWAEDELNGVVDRLEQDAEHRPLVWQEIQMLKKLSTRFPKAHELLNRGAR